LIPDRGALPPEWVTQSETESGDVARRIADDIVRAGFPYLESKASPEAYFAEFTEQVWRLLWPHEAAVAHMMHGDLEEAKRMLLTIARPVSQHPASWAAQDKPSADFFDAFAAHFGVDLEIDEWPAKGSAVKLSAQRAARRLGSTRQVRHKPRVQRDHDGVLTGL
jgi:hypothetical protein